VFDVSREITTACGVEAEGGMILLPKAIRDFCRHRQSLGPAPFPGFFAHVTRDDGSFQSV
jgi:hypothetical protein